MDGRAPLRLINWRHALCCPTATAAPRANAEQRLYSTTSEGPVHVLQQQHPPLWGFFFPLCGLPTFHRRTGTGTPMLDPDKHHPGADESGRLPPTDSSRWMFHMFLEEWHAERSASEDGSHDLFGTNTLFNPQNNLEFSLQVCLYWWKMTDGVFYTGFISRHSSSALCRAPCCQLFSQHCWTARLKQKFLHLFLLFFFFLL